MKHISLYLLCCLLFFALPSNCQEDSVYAPKSLLRASGEFTSTELAPWSFNHFVRKAAFSNISASSIRRNSKLSSWQWDDNKFRNNAFSHPYHGNLYFNSFRSNNYSFYTAAAATVTGSLLWEIGGETTPPAPNDFVNTSLGGITLGEMTYRLSQRIVSGKATRRDRQLREVLAFMINPMNGFTRLMKGQWGKTPAVAVDSATPLQLQVEWGSRRYSSRVNQVLQKGKNESFGRVQLQYGDPFRRFKKPFDQFRVTTELGSSDTALLNLLTVQAGLHGWPIFANSKNRHIAKLSLGYDYVRNTAFLYGAQSFQLVLSSAYNAAHKTQFFSEIGASFIALGAVPDHYRYYGEGRNYDYGSGAGIIVSGKMVCSNKLFYGINYRGSLLQTWNGSSSSYSLHTVTSEARYRLKSGLSFGLEWGQAMLNGRYASYPNTRKEYPYIRFSTGYQFGH